MRLEGWNLLPSLPSPNPFRCAHTVGESKAFALVRLDVNAPPVLALNVAAECVAYKVGEGCQAGAVCNVFHICVSGAYWAPAAPWGSSLKMRESASSVDCHHDCSAKRARRSAVVTFSSAMETSAAFAAASPIARQNRRFAGVWGLSCVFQFKDDADAVNFAVLHDFEGFVRN